MVEGGRGWSRAAVDGRLELPLVAGQVGGVVHLQLPNVTQLRVRGDVVLGVQCDRVVERPAHHVADAPLLARPEVNAVLGQMKRFSEAIISGRWKGCTGKAVTDIVNIGGVASTVGVIFKT
jgi:hypothetical protein